MKLSQSLLAEPAIVHHPTFGGEVPRNAREERARRDSPTGSTRKAKGEPTGRILSLARKVRPGNSSILPGLRENPGHTYAECPGFKSY